jgi:hypothetical protein
VHRRNIGYFKTVRGVSGLSDRDFYHLIGIRVEDQERVTRHHLWADAAEDEERIWKGFLDILSGIEKPVLLHYGSFETTFLKRMCERYGGSLEESDAAKAIASSIMTPDYGFGQYLVNGICVVALGSGVGTSSLTLSTTSWVYASRN